MISRERHKRNEEKDGRGKKGLGRDLKDMRQSGKK